MARLTNKSELSLYVKSQLGAPTINIEVSDFQIFEIIDDAIQKFTEYAYGTLEAAVIVQISGMGTYTMPDTMTNIIKLSKGATSNITNFNANFAGYVPDIWSNEFFSSSLTGGVIDSIIGISTTTAVLDKFFGDDLVYNFNYLSKNLQVLEDYKGPVVIHYQYEYIANATYDLVYNHEWIKRYCIARTKKLWGSITGKYSQNLVGGASINYADMKSESEQELQDLREELLSKWSDPAPIDIA